MYDKPPKNPEDAAPDEPPGQDLDRAEYIDTTTPELVTVKDRIIDSQARLLDGIAEMIEDTINNDPHPKAEDYLTDHEWQVAATSWDARMFVALDELAQLHGRVMALGDLLDELRTMKRIMT